MKLISTSTSRSLIKVHLLKYQIYKNFKNLNFKICFKNLIFELKQALKIIYLYNKKKKKILFIGFPYNKILHNQITHTFMSKQLLLKKIQMNNVNFTKSPNLIVINNFSYKDKQIIKNFEKQNIPLILFNKNLTPVINKKFYNIQMNFNKPKIKKLIFFLIFSILTKTCHK